MSEKINWTFRAQVIDGPLMIASGKLVMDAYDKLEVTVSAGGEKTVDVQPAAGAHLLLITASAYDSITYRVDGRDANTLDNVHILIGNGAVRLLGSTQKQFVFQNSSINDVVVEILVGRDLVPIS